MNKRDSCGLLTLGLPFRHHHFAQLPAEALEPALHFLKGLLLYPVNKIYITVRQRSAIRVAGFADFPPPPEKGNYYHN